MIRTNEELNKIIDAFNAGETADKNLILFLHIDEVKSAEFLQNEAALK